MDDSCELEDAGDYSTAVIRAYPILKGGKGGQCSQGGHRSTLSLCHLLSLHMLLLRREGFGSLIRAMGMQINKSTNKNACRDLSGRRVRDVKAEKE